MATLITIKGGSLVGVDTTPNGKGFYLLDMDGDIDVIELQQITPARHEAMPILELATEIAQSYHENCEVRVHGA